MDAKEFKSLVSKVTAGKKLPDAIYLHTSALSAVPNDLINFVTRIEAALKVEKGSWHLLKLFKNEFKVSLLSYPTFEEDSYPALNKSITIDLGKLSARETNYDSHDNPPILHRKETMVLPSHPKFAHFCSLTKEGDEAGLYKNSRKIGFLQSWMRVIAENGFELNAEGRIVSSNSSQRLSESDELEVHRHKTALVRQGLSTPMKTLAKHEFLSGDYSIFDYGCGRGDDLRELEAHGLDALGWDPNYLPDADRVVSDIVNLGFVINVIEDRIERTEAIVEAWHLTNKLLVVSAMLGSESIINQFQPYKDGVLTARNTFQKYFTQGELKEYLEMTLDEQAIAVAPGVFYIFKDKLEEQSFLQSRYKRNYQWQQKTLPEASNSADERVIFAKHSAVLEEFWSTVLNLGRCPASDEFAKTDELKLILGSLKKAFNLTHKHYGDADLQLARAMREDDIILYMALSQFAKRKAYSKQSDSFKRDIKALFTDYKTAQEIATERLYSIADRKLIEELCLQAHELLPASKLAYEKELPHSLTLHKKFIADLPLTLRIYLGAALQLYGELEDIQLVKIHITSGKLTLLGYEGFYDTPLPKLKERVKIDMAGQDVYFFDYVNSANQPLLVDKIDYIDESFEDFSKQKSFSNRLKKIVATQLDSDTNLTISTITEMLQNSSLNLKGYRFFQL